MVRGACLALPLVVLGCTGDGAGPDGGGDTDTDTGAPLVFIEGYEKRIDGTAETVDAEPESTRMCVLDSGAVVVAWVDFRGGRTRIWARTSPAGASWPVPIQVNTADKPATSVDLACSGDTALVVWEDERLGDAGNPAVYAARSTDLGVTWTDETLLAGSAAGATQHREPRVAATPDGFHVVWYEDGDGAYDIYTRRSVDGGATFEAPLRLDSDGAGLAWSAHPVVAADSDGSVVVAWEDLRNGVVDIYTARSSDGGATFTGDGRLDGGDGNSYAPQLVVGGGQAYATWHDERDGDFLEVYAAHLTTAGWSDAFRLQEGPPAERDRLLPTLALADDGLLNVVWFEASDGGYHVMHAQVRDGAPQGEPLRLDHAPSAAQLSYPQVVVEGQRQVVAWRDDRGAAGEGDNDLFYVHSADGGSSFSPDLRLDSAPDGAGAAFDVALTLRDNLVLATWCDQRPSAPGVYIARFSVGDTAPFPP